MQQRYEIISKPRIYTPRTNDSNRLLENTNIWLTSIEGNRKYQEDGAGYGCIPFLSKLTHEDRAQVIKETFARLQNYFKQSGIRSGSTAQIAITVKDGNDLIIYTGTCGGSESMLLLSTVGSGTCSTYYLF